MDERFDRLEKMIGELKKEVAAGSRSTNARIDINSRQIAGLSRRIDSLTTDQRQLAARLGERLEKVEAKAQITIEGHQAIRAEMHREFATLRRDLQSPIAYSSS